MAIVLQSAPKALARLRPMAGLRQLAMARTGAKIGSNARGPTLSISAAITLLALGFAIEMACPVKAAGDTSPCGLPVEITAKFENWRHIRDCDGDEGWVYHALLSGKRMAAVQLKTKTDLAPLFQTPDAHSAIIARLQVGVLGSVKHCTGTWCQISGDGFAGWIEQSALWGVYPDEKIE